MDGGCQISIGALAVIDKTILHETSVSSVHLTGMVGSTDGQRVLIESYSGSDPKQIGWKLAEKMIQLGANSILDRQGMNDLGMISKKWELPKIKLKGRYIW